MGSALAFHPSCLSKAILSLYFVTILSLTVEFQHKTEGFCEWAS